MPSEMGGFFELPSRFFSTDEAFIAIGKNCAILCPSLGKKHNEGIGVIYARIKRTSNSVHQGSAR